MTNREKLEANEKKQRIIAERGFRCEVCGKPVNYSTAQLAHRVPKTAYNLKHYGSEVINHELNLAVVCSLKCNSAVLCNPASRPVEAHELIEKIKEQL